MNNSYADYLLGVYRNIFADVVDSFPDLQKDCERDYSRLTSLVKTRGHTYLMLDLVQSGKHFDRCLADGLLTLYKTAGFRSWKRGRVIPRLFRGFHEKIFDESGMLRNDFSPLLVGFLRTLFYVSKKFKQECTDVRKWQAISEFFEVEEGLPRSPEWDYDDPRWESDGKFNFRACHRSYPDSRSDLFDLSEEVPPIPDELTEISINAAFRLISSSIGVFVSEEWGPKHGPGAVSDQRFGISKYEFPSWPDKLDRVFPLDRFAFASYNQWVDFVCSGDTSRFSKNEYPSRLICVPKTVKGPRLIAAEPVSHQWAQQCMLDFFATRIRETWLSSFVHLRDQSQNASLARRASHTQECATIDLSSASDYVSTYLVERLFGHNWSILDGLHASRTRWVTNPVDAHNPRFHKLRKFACMGSACTFPVQTLLFLGIALGTILRVRNKLVTFKNVEELAGQVRVFGDDIIVPADAAKQVVEALCAAGFKVNESKTFLTGKFRESCGTDAYDGEVVTPLYVTRLPSHSAPESVLSCLETSNNFYRRGYFRVARFLREQLSKLGYSFLRVDQTQGATGELHDAPDNSHLKVRVNHALQRRELLCHVPLSRNTKQRDRGDSCLLQYFTEGPEPTTPWTSGYLDRRPSTILRRRWVAC